MNPVIVTLTGPSCAGKSTLENMLVERGFGKAVSHTTRQPRAGEVPNESYYFVEPLRFDEGLRLGNFIEHVEFGGNKYGLAISEIKRHAVSNKPIVVVCEPNGRDQIAAFCASRKWCHLPIYVGNPIEVIMERLVDRLMNDVWEKGKGASKAHAQRLAVIMHTESKWIKEAQDNPKVYSALVERFDGTNDKQIADYITWYVNQVIAGNATLVA